ncbi:tape measure protein [Mannheimia pernigra]|uniref:tape measure protein n=1 Tax=Mannheimia pernigra TaxID=111844 RepID=UPI00159F43D5|nr:tape measure protein [Mannheimia pernigra]QLB44482.1 tape measure protein [Mannheimia pernigra]
MADLATLAIKIETEGASKAQNDLSKIEQSAKKTEKASDSLAKSINNLKRLLAVAGLAGGLSAYLDMAEKMQSMNAQLKFVTNSQYEFNNAQKELFAIAQNTRASFESTTQLYIKSSQALKDYGYAQKDILKFTETINKAMAVGGVGAQEQASALLQLSQALGSGQLQGDEFKTIAESAPIILDTIAEYMGKSRAEVKKLASEGKITADLLFNAFNGSSAKITEKFNQMPLTFGGAMQQLQNATLKFIGDLDSANGLSGMLAQAISFLAQNFDVLGKALIYATGAYIAFNAVAFAQNFTKATSGVGLLSSAFGYLTTMIRGATVAMMANPIGLLITAIIGAAFVFDAFISDIEVGAATFDATWGDVATTVWEDFKELTSDAADWLVTQWDKATASAASSFSSLGVDIGSVWETVQSITKTLINSITGLFVGAYQAIVLAWNNFPAAMENLAVLAINGLIGLTEKGINKLVELIKTPIDMINEAMKYFGGEGFDTSGFKVDFSGFKLEASSEAKAVGQSISQAFADSITTDYIGNAVNSVSDYIDGAAVRGRLKRQLDETASDDQGTQSPAKKTLTGNNNSASDWKNYLNELERANADGLARIALEQDRSMREMLEKAKKAGASHAEIEKAKMLITERYAKERMEIAEKYVPSLKFEEELKDQIKEIDELQKLNLITTEQAGLAKEALAGKYQPVVEIQQQYINQLREIEALKQAGVLSEPQAEVAAEKAKWDNGTQKAKIAGENAVSPYEKWKAEFDPMQAIQNEQASKLAEVQSMYDQHLIQYEDFVNAKAQIDAKATADTHQLFMNSISGFGSAIDTMLGVMKNAGQEQSGIYRTMFAMSKAFAIAESILNLNRAITQAMSDQTAITPAQKFANMAAVASAGASLISNIQSVSLGGMAHSGIDNVPKEGTWLLDKGERVVDSRTNQDLKTFLSNANRGGASGQRSVINVKIINNGQPVEAKVSSEETVDGNIQMTVELLKKMDQIADQRYRRNQLNDLRTGGTLSK